MLIFQVLIFSFLGSFFNVIWRILFSCWILPGRAHMKLKKNGFRGPTPNFPLGNHREIKRISREATVSSSSSSSSGSSKISNDIHSSVFPYFSQWQKSHGKTHDLLLLLNFFVF